MNSPGAIPAAVTGRVSRPAHRRSGTCSCGSGVCGQPFLGPGDPVLGEAKAPILLTWTTDSLLPELAEAAREVDGIGAVATARNGVGWLTSWTAEGRHPRSAPGRVYGADRGPGGGSRRLLRLRARLPQGAVRGPGERRGAARLIRRLASRYRRKGLADLRQDHDPGGRSRPRRAGLQPRGGDVARHQQDASGISDLKYVLVELDRGTDRAEAEQALRAKLPAGRPPRPERPRRRRGLPPGREDPSPGRDQKAVRGVRRPSRLRPQHDGRPEVGRARTPPT